MTYDHPPGGQPWPQQGQPWPQQQQYPPGQQPHQPYGEPWPPQQQQSQYYPPQRPPKKKRHLVRNILLGLAGIIVLIVISSIAANKGGKGTPAASSSSSSTPAASSKSTPAASSKSTPANAAPAAKIGTPVRDGKFQFTITSVSHAKTAGDTADGLGASAQGKYTILHVTVTNIGSQPQTLDDSSQYVYDASGRKYDASTNADIYLNGSSDSVFLNDINPGNTVKGKIAFDMPAGVKAVKAELHDSAFSGGISVSLR